MRASVIDGGSQHNNEVIQRTFCSHKTRAFINVSLGRGYLADVVFYTLFWRLHRAYCNSLYQSQCFIPKQEVINNALRVLLS